MAKDSKGHGSNGKGGSSKPKVAQSSWGGGPKGNAALAKKERAAWDREQRRRMKLK